MDKHETILSTEETLRERRREEVKYWLTSAALFIVFGVISTSLFWGPIVLGWLMEKFR